MTCLHMCLQLVHVVVAAVSVMHSSVLDVIPVICFFAHELFGFEINLLMMDMAFLLLAFPLARP